MKSAFYQRRYVAALIAAILIILACIYYLDARVALGVNSLLNENPYLKKSVRDIPNLLPLAVGAGTAGLWIAYLMLRRRGNSSHTPFLKLAMIIVPVAYLIKMLLQYVFGRTSVRLWLQNGGEIAFDWFTPLSNHPCFPSGHMTVSTAFFVAVWLHYPRCRPFVIASLTVLGAALVLTNNHYLGDVIAGFICGILITTVTSHLIERTENAK